MVDVCKFTFFYLRPLLLTLPLPNLVSWKENCGHILDVVSLEMFEVFHLCTKRSEVLTDVVSPSLILGETLLIQVGSLTGYFTSFLRLYVFGLCVCACVRLYLKNKMSSVVISLGDVH